MRDGLSFPWWTPGPAGRTTEHSQLCQQLGRALHLHFFNLTFWFLLPPPKSFQKLSWSRHPPAPVSPSRVCCTSLRDSLLPLLQRGEEGAAGDLQPGQGEEKHRAHFQVESLLLLTKTLQFSAELLSVFKSAPFISLPLVPDSLSRQDTTNETFRNESKRCGKQQGECGKATLLFLFNVNIPLKPGTDKM